MTVPDIEMAEPNTVVPTRPKRTASWVLSWSKSCALRKTPSSIKSTMKEVPETGSIPVSPITRTAIAPSKKVVMMSTVANTKDARTENPPTVKINNIATNVTPMKIGMCLRGHSYHPLPSMYSWLPSPLKAVPMSEKILRNVLYIFARPNIPPPTMEPIAMVRTEFEKAIICNGAPPPLA